MLQTQRCGGSAGLALGYYIFAAMRLMSRRMPLITRNLRRWSCKCGAWIRWMAFKYAGVDFWGNVAGN
jgi:hypothetical protein